MTHRVQLTPDGSIPDSETSHRVAIRTTDPIGEAAERRRESRLGAANVRVVRFSYDEVLDAGKLERLLTAYGVPRA